MSTTSSTLDGNSPRSSNNVPRSGLNLATPSRPSSSSNQDLNLSLNTSPSSYISVSNVATAGGLQKNETTLDYQTQAELQSHYVQHQPPTSQQSQSQYCRLGTGGLIGPTTPTSLPPTVSLQERSSIIVPVTTHDVDPFVVTVRSSPNKLGKSSSSSFISKTPSSVNCGSSKTGPRLALYRSNSSLDLLDRENYYHHQRASLGGAKLTSHHVHPHQHGQQLDRHSFQPQSSKAHSNKAETNYTGCFTRRKDFGSHGSIDVLANAGGNNTSDPGTNTTTTGNSSSSAGSSKNERSSSLGNSSTGHFLSLVASTMSRDRRGSFDVHDDTVVGQNTRDSSGGSSGGGGGVSGGGGGKSSSSKGGSNTSAEPVLRDTASPRLRLKFQKLWEHKEKSTVTQSNSTGPMSGGAQTDGSNSSSTSGSKGNISGNTSKAEASIFRKLRGNSTTSRNNGNTKSLPEGVKFDVLPSSNHTGGGDVSESQGNEKPVLRHGAPLMEERYRRRVFAHFDCQSVSANISYVARLRNLLSKRRNTTTGASAASLGHRPVSTPPSASLNNIAGAPGAQLSLTNDNASLDLVPADDPDLGDGNSNNLILSCPYFRNEIGGEEERLVCLTRFKSTKPASVLRSNYLHMTSSGSNIGHHGGSLDSASMSLGRGGTIGNGNRIMNHNSSLDGSFHRPQQARGLSILEWSPGTTHWVHGTCPYSKSSSRQTALEPVDLGAAYYRKYFYRQDRQPELEDIETNSDKRAIILNYWPGSED
ncbi:unnamed protein product [Allacma fusca]|uniref:Uncharacterized protein n=1 Tax=Allacma fusca TaxID=39272 RepID=A0A8J2KLC5_9HEXA|nr:unnamed protein product [Allacma fusca]